MRIAVREDELPALRQKPNFELRANAHVLRVNLDSTGRSARGVTYVDAQGREIEQAADLVILSAFQFHNVRLMLLEVKDLSVRFGGVVALDRVSFSVDAGQVVALIGPNGAGKTTLFNVITRVYRASHGTVLVDGKPVQSIRAHDVIRLGLARTFQNVALFRSMTVLENVLVGDHVATRSGWLQASVPLPGAVSAPIASISLDAIRGQTGTNSAAPLGGIPLGGIPLGGIPLGGIPLGGIPLGGIGFTAQNLTQNGLGGVPLSTIPLVLPDTWDAHLALDPAFKGTPSQNVTLAQVLGTQVVAGIDLQDLSLSSSPLGGIPLGGIALGALPLGGIPLGGIANTPPDQNRADWCAFINQQPGYNCPNGDSQSGKIVKVLPQG